MFDLRFVERDGKRILQWRQVPCQIGWSKGDDTPVIQPKSPISLVAEKNWTEWADVPTLAKQEPEVDLGCSEHGFAYRGSCKFCVGAELRAKVRTSQDGTK